MTVGTLGALGARWRPVTASTLTLPVCISGVTIASDDDRSWMRFSERSFGACRMSR
jgi:hypothetical protein